MLMCFLTHFRIKGFTIEGVECAPIIHLRLNENYASLSRKEEEDKLDSYVDQVCFIFLMHFSSMLQKILCFYEYYLLGGKG